jgi:regulatory protein
MCDSDETGDIVKIRDAAYSAALRFIRYRPRSVFEVIGKLKEKGYSPGIRNEITERLAEEGYLDDREFSVAWAKEKYYGRNLGPARIEYELRRKGIDREIIREVIEDLIHPEDLPETAVRFLEVKYRGHVRDIPDVKLTGVLLRNGFTITQAKEAVKRVKR